MNEVINFADAKQKRQQKQYISADLIYVPEQHEIPNGLSSGLSYHPTTIDSATVPFGKFSVSNFRAAA